MGCKGLGVFLVANQFYAASLAATTGMNLGLDHPFGSANLVAGLCRRVWTIDCIALGHRQAIFSKQLLTLILVEIHAFLPS